MLSALWSAGVSNCKVLITNQLQDDINLNINQYEIPILDGSAVQFSQALLGAVQVTELKAIPIIKVVKEVTLYDAIKASRQVICFYILICD